MIIAVGILVFIAACSLSLVGLGESHSRVSRILNEMDDNRMKEDTVSKPVAVMESVVEQENMGVFTELGFTRSLLALSKVHSPVPCATPTPEHDESSLLVSVRRSQSRSPVQVL